MLAQDVTTLINEVDALNNVKTMTSSVITMTNAQMKAATQITIVTAPGAGFSIFPIMAILKMNYGGSNTFTNSPIIQFNWNAVTECMAVPGTAAFMQGTQSQSQSYVNNLQVDENSTLIENQSITCVLVPAVTGNASNNNTMSIVLVYNIVPM